MSTPAPKWTRSKVKNLNELHIHKWTQPVMEEGFTPLPKKVLRTLHTLFRDVRDLQVVLAIVDFDRPQLPRHPSYDYLAWTVGLPVEDFKKRVQRMQEEGWLVASGPDSQVHIDLSGFRSRVLQAVEIADNPPKEGPAESQETIDIDF